MRSLRLFECASCGMRVFMLAPADERLVIEMDRPVRGHECAGSTWIRVRVDEKSRS